MAKEKEKIILSRLEKTLLYNFVMGESNRLTFPSAVDNINTGQDNLDVEIRIKPSYTNLNNFNGDRIKYEKALSVLKKKLTGKPNFTNLWWQKNKQKMKSYYEQRKSKARNLGKRA